MRNFPLPIPRFFLIVLLSWFQVTPGAEINSSRPNASDQSNPEKIRQLLHHRQIDQLLANWREGKQVSRDETNNAVWDAQIALDATSTSEIAAYYVVSVKASLIDPINRGKHPIAWSKYDGKNWYYISNEATRSMIVEQLNRYDSIVDDPLLTFARIWPALLDDDETTIQQCLETLEKQDKYFCDRAKVLLQKTRRILKPSFTPLLRASVSLDELLDAGISEGGWPDSGRDLPDAIILNKAQSALLEELQAMNKPGEQVEYGGYLGKTQTGEDKSVLKLGKIFSVNSKSLTERLSAASAQPYCDVHTHPDADPIGIFSEWDLTAYVTAKKVGVVVSRSARGPIGFMAIPTQRQAKELRQLSFEAQQNRNLMLSPMGFQYAYRRFIDSRSSAWPSSASVLEFLPPAGSRKPNDEQLFYEILMRQYADELGVELYYTRDFREFRRLPAPAGVPTLTSLCGRDLEQPLSQSQVLALKFWALAWSGSKPAKESALVEQWRGRSFKLDAVDLARIPVMSSRLGLSERRSGETWGAWYIRLLAKINDLGLLANSGGNAYSNSRAYLNFPALRPLLVATTSTDGKKEELFPACRVSWWLTLPNQAPQFRAEIAWLPPEELAWWMSGRDFGVHDNPSPGTWFFKASLVECVYFEPAESAAKAGWYFRYSGAIYQEGTWSRNGADEIFVGTTTWDNGKTVTGTWINNLVAKKISESQQPAAEASEAKKK